MLFAAYFPHRRRYHLLGSTAVMECEGQNTVVFAGRERGEFTRDGVTVPLAIRTTRVFQYFGGELGWRQVHHHGSVDDPEALARYRRAVFGE
jgi:hypothetical protein